MAEKKIRIILDIGHGSDTFDRTGGKGVIVGGKKYEEHDFNSLVAIALEKKLTAAGFEVIMYQKPFSKEIDLNKRISYYNTLNADLVWSIHANAGSNNVDGRCAFYWYSNSAMKKLAEKYGEEVKKAGYSTHGNGTHASMLNSWTNLAITRATTADAVLTENGFMTNNEPGINDDFELLFGSKQAEYVEDVSEFQFKAICWNFDVSSEDVQQVSKPVESKPAKSKSMTAPADRLGEVKLKMDMNYRAAPSLDAKVLRVLKAGHGSNGNVHYYDKKGDWLRLGVGWVSNADGKYVDITKVYGQKEKPASKAAASKTNSIVDYLNARGRDSDFDTRAKLAEQYGIRNYSGDPDQNLQLLDRMRSGYKNPAPKPKKEYVQLPASVKEWRTYKLSVPPQKKYSDWSITPAKYGGLEYAILGRPYANVVTIKTSKGKRNIYVGPDTDAKIVKK